MTARTPALSKVGSTVTVGRDQYLEAEEDRRADRAAPPA
jgi:hypothetical protein